MRRREFLAGLAGAPLLEAAVTPFAERLLDAPEDGGFRMEGYWVWCGSAIRGEDGRYHLFASRWPRSLSFSPHWLTNSEIVRAVADKPEGPYQFAEVVLGARGEKFWDGRMAHNPTIHKSGGTYLLYYTGATYGGATPQPGRPAGDAQRLEARANQRIGLATAASVKGPWTRPERPLLEPRPGKWDALMTTNPAPCILPDGGALLIYKSTADQKDLLRMGVAKAPHWRGPYQRAKDGELFRFENPKDHIEDAYVWRSGGGFELLMKDMNGGIGGERGAGLNAVSNDGIEWRIARPALAYSRTIRYAGGRSRTFHRVERPQLLVEGGKPRVLYVAVADGAGGKIENTWNVAIPLK